MEGKHHQLSYIVSRLKKYSSKFSHQELIFANSLISLDLNRQKMPDLIKLVNPHFNEQCQKAKQQFNELAKKNKYLENVTYDFIFFDQGKFKYKESILNNQGIVKGITRSYLNNDQKIKYIQTMFKLQQIKKETYEKCLLKFFEILRIYQQISTNRSNEKSMNKSEISNSSIIQQRIQNQFEKDAQIKDASHLLSTKSTKNKQKSKQINMSKKRQVQTAQTTFQLRRTIEKMNENHQKDMSSLKKRNKELQDKLTINQQSQKKTEEQRKALQTQCQILRNNLNRQKVKLQNLQNKKCGIQSEKSRLQNAIFQQTNKREQKQYEVNSCLVIIYSLSKKMQMLTSDQKNRNQSIEQITNQINTVNKDVIRLKEYLKQEQKEKKQLIQQNQTLAINISKLMEMKNRQEDSLQIQKLNKENQKLQEKNLDLQNKIKSMEVINLENNNVINNYNQKMNIFEEQIIQSKKIVQQLNQTKGMINALYQQNNKLLDENKKLNLKNQQLIKENKKSDNNNRDIQNLIKDQIITIKKELIQKYQGNIHQNQSTVRQLTSINNNLERENRQYKERIVMLTHQNQRLNNSIRIIAQQKEELQKNIQDSNLLINKIQKQKQNLVSLLEQQKIKLESHKNKQQQINFSYKQLQSQKDKLQNKIQLSQELLSQVSTALTVSPILQSSKSKKDKLISYIQSFTNCKVMKSQLKFKYDKYYQNFSFYLNSQSYPFVVLFKLAKTEKIIGAFTTGIAFSKALHSHQAFIFSLEGQGQIMKKRENNSQKCPVFFKDNILTFGNSELSIKNNSSEQAFRLSVNTLGKPYFDIPSKQALIEVDNKEDMIGFEEMEIHRIYY